MDGKVKSRGVLATVTPVQPKLERKKEQGEEERVLAQYISGARAWGGGEGIPGKITPPARDARRPPRSLLPSEITPS